MSIADPDASYERSERFQADPEFDEAAESSRVLEQVTDNVPLGLILQVSVFAIVGMLLLMLVPEALLSIRLLVIAIVFLTLKRWGGVLVLILVQADLFFREGRGFAMLSGSQGILFVVIVVAVLMLVARHRTLLREIAAGSIFSVARNFLNPDSDSQAAPDTTARLALRVSGSGLRGFVLVSCCVAVARLLIGLFPTSRELSRNLRGMVNADPAFQTGVIMIFTLVALWVVISEVAWRQISSAQARVYLRSAFLKIHYRDLRMVVKRRLKLRQKQVAATRTGKNREKT